MTSQSVLSANQSAVAAWNNYFDAVEQSMHEFEVALSRHDVFDLRPIEPPGGRPPESFRRRGEDLQRWITELEFRARFLREEFRAEITRVRPQAARRSESRVGATLDING
ncbi:hypothetical protein LWF15_02715 [Kineosporia rhizophila]|uniref:hypothetical protein n=1 Tax=Kineosporia TaxID=49184 RepID=UPI001E5101F5|nr:MULTISPECIES: hypothetical protein [Kineosporia]MCE0534410.1 hypothetical protein [Kineosporia rhizophila]GLY13944.1 hypothetical protein Kisp01_09600 [Kineosporia sp. NBRC 101677]